MEFRRKVYDELLEWKNTSKGRSAVMLQGARRVGKSTIVEKFAKEQYRSYILIDFFDTENEIRNYFTKYRTDLDMLFARLQLETKTKLYERESLIIFDEVQSFPLAREMIKSLVKDRRYDYIETGSLITIKSISSKIRVPSEEHKIDMHPMDFEEWLWANGDDVTADMLRELMEKKEPLGDDAHGSILRKYLEYMIIGGMPGVVSSYLEDHDIMAAESVKGDILDLYRDDIHKIKGLKTSERALNLFNSTPALLSSPHKILSPGKVEKGTRRRDYDGAIEWLCDAKIYNRCRCSTDPGVAIGLSQDMSRVKCYFLDTGLLISLAFQHDKEGLAETYGLILDGELSFNKGMLFENMVAQELVCRGYDLWFTEFEKKGTARKYEVDFILPGRGGIVPLEIKSGRSSSHPSLDALIDKYRDRVVEAFVIHSKDIRTDGELTYVPIYMMPFLKWRRSDRECRATALYTLEAPFLCMEPNMVKNQLSLDECLKLLDSTGVCVLSLNGPDGWPYSVPVNFVRIGDKLYYHGRRTGTRVRCMEGDDRCTLVAYSEDGYEDYGENACDTTTLFGSVVVRGRVRSVESDDLKLTVLKAMLEKVTPEKKDFPINTEIVSRTGMFEISIEEITGKHREARPGSRTMPA